MRPFRLSMALNLRLFDTIFVLDVFRSGDNFL